MRFWTKKESKFLTENYMKMGNIEISKNINRTVAAIVRKLKRLSLKRPTDVNYKIRFTKEIREKMSAAQKQRFKKDDAWNKGLTKDTDERLMKMSKKFTGRYVKDEWRRNHSVAQKEYYKTHSVWNKGLTKDMDERIMKAAKKFTGRYFDETWRKHLSESHKGQKSHPNQRKAASEWTKANCPTKRPEIKAKISGKNHHNWKGGITSQRRKFYTSMEYLDWRKKVFERDGYQCQSCLKKPSNNLNVHHIYKRNDYPELRLDVDNGITLCKDCHSFITGKENQFVEWCLILQNEDYQMMERLR